MTKDEKIDQLQAEINMLRMLYESQAEVIERMGQTVEVGGLHGSYEFTMLKDGTLSIFKL